MKLGIVADEIDRDFRTAVENGKKLGINCFEVRFLKTGRAPMCDADELREVAEIASGEGVEITNLSPGLFKYTTDETAFRREMDEIFSARRRNGEKLEFVERDDFRFRQNGRERR